MTDTNTTSSPQEAVVQVRDVQGVIKNIHNVAEDVLQPDGTIQTVERQVVEIRDNMGNVIDLSGGKEVVQLLRRIVQQNDILIQQAQEISGKRFDSRLFGSLSDVA